MTIQKLEVWGKVNKGIRRIGLETSRYLSPALKGKSSHGWGSRCTICGIRRGILGCSVKILMGISEEVFLACI